MASLIAYTKLQLIQRIRQHMADGWPSAQFSTSENEVLLYIDQALAYGLVGQVFQNAKIEGNLVMPEGYLTTYALPALQQDSITKEWYSELPQPPVSLPLGYSITGGYFANAQYGRGKSIFLIKNHRVAYREDMPLPPGVRGWVEGSTIKLKASDGSSLFGETLYITMASTRTSSMTDVMNLPDDAIELIFQNVVSKMKDRMMIPKDIIADDLPAGNKSS